MFKLTSNAAAVYAGDVQAGEECLNSLTKRLRTGGTADQNRSPEIAGEIFCSVYSSHKAKRPYVPPLYVLVGACNSQGRAELWYFDSAQNFLPVQKTGVQALGPEKTTKRYKTALESVVKENLRPNSSWPLEPEVWAIYIVSALYTHIIEPSFDVTVGGKIPCVVIDKDGYRDMEIAWTKDATNVGGSWNRVTPNPGDLITYQEHLRKQSQSLIECGFGLYDISS